MKTALKWMVALSLLIALGCLESPSGNDDDDNDNGSVQDTTGTTDTTGSGTDTTGNGTDTSGTDTTGNGTTTQVDDGTMVIGSSSYDVASVTVVIVSGTYSISAKSADGKQVISISLKDGFPDAAQTYTIAPLASDDAVGLSATDDTKLWSLSYMKPNLGEVTITPSGTQVFGISFNGIKLWDNGFAPTDSVTVGAQFDVKVLGGEFTLKEKGDTYTAMLTSGGVIPNFSALQLVGTMVNQDNRSGTLTIYLHKDSGTGTYTITAGTTAMQWLNCAPGNAYIIAQTYNSNGTATINDIGQSGTLDVVKTGTEYKVTFTAIPTQNESGTDELTGEIEVDIQ